MRLFEFLESRYVSTNIELQKEYTAAKHAETLAVQSLINGNRTVLKWLAYPKLLFLFLLVKMHILSRPLSPKEINDKMQAEAKAKAEEAAAKQAEIDAATRATILPPAAGEGIDPKDANRADAIALQLAKQKAEAQAQS